MHSSRLGAIDAVLLILVGHVAFSGVMFAPVYLDWIAAMGTTPASSIASLWTLAAPAAGMAVGGPLFTWLERDFGVLRMLRLSCALIFLSGSMGMLADSVWQLLLARGLVGLAAAAMLVSTTAVFRMRYPGGVWRDWRRRQDMVIALSAVFGLVFVALLAQRMGWRAPFLLHTVGLSAYVLVWWLSTRPSVVALVNRYEMRQRARMEGRRGTRRVPNFERGPAATRPLLWMLVLTMFVVMLHFFGLVQVVSAVVATEWGQHAMGVAIALSGLFLGTALALWKGHRVTARYGEALTVALLFGVCAIGFWWMSRVQTIVQLTAVMAWMGMGFGGLRPALVSWFDTVTRREHRSARLYIAIPAYYLGIAFSPLFVLYVQEWRSLQQVCAGWMLLIAAVYAGTAVRHKTSDTTAP